MTRVDRGIRNWGRLIEAFGPPRFRRQSLIARITTIQHLLRQAGPLAAHEMFPEGFFLLKVLTERFRSMPTFKVALAKYTGSGESNSDRLFLADLQALKMRLGEGSYNYDELRAVNAMAQRARIKRK